MTLHTNEPGRSEHPVDVVERIASLKSWIFAREGDDEICITVTGGWTDYQISFTWLEDVEALHLACAFDLKLNERRRNEILALVSLINEQMWVGHFGLWEDEGVVLFRHTLLLTGGAEPTIDQCEAAVQAGVAACERYFQAFNFVLWAGKSAREALTTALFETAGEA
ncbi:MAG: YbjN domain-containing protein [Beijerinckiaceae bacterium]